LFVSTLFLAQLLTWVIISCWPSYG